MLISEKIILFMTAWMILIFFLTLNAIVEIFFILIFIGFLLVKVFIDRFTRSNLKIRINIFILFFLIVFSLIIGERILSFLVI